MVVTVAAYLVVNALEDQGTILERLEWLEDRFESKRFAFFVRPEFVRQCAIWRKHDDQSLTPLRDGRADEAGQTGQKRHRGSRDAEIAEGGTEIEWDQRERDTV